MKEKPLLEQTPCNNPKLREELINAILQLNNKYTREETERAIDLCCSEGKPNIEGCAKERTKALYLNRVM